LLCGLLRPGGKINSVYLPAATFEALQKESVPTSNVQHARVRVVHVFGELLTNPIEPEHVQCGLTARVVRHILFIEAGVYL